MAKSAMKLGVFIHTHNCHITLLSKNFLERPYSISTDDFQPAMNFKLIVAWYFISLVQR